MKPIQIFFVALLSFAALPSVAQVKATAEKENSTTTQTSPHRIVYDMAATDTAQHSMLIRQLNNVKRGWPDAEIEVVVHGKALEMLVNGKSTKAGAIKELQEKGMVFAACENTMRAQGVAKEQLLPGIVTVPMGIGEIIMKQEEGWGYIRF